MFLSLLIFRYRSFALIFNCCLHFIGITFSHRNFWWEVPLWVVKTCYITCRRLRVVVVVVVVTRYIIIIKQMSERTLTSLEVVSSDSASAEARNESARLCHKSARLRRGYVTRSRPLSCMPSTIHTDTHAAAPRAWDKSTCATTIIYCGMYIRIHITL